MPILELPGLYVDTVAAIVALPRPALVNRDPGPDETGVPIDSRIALEIVDTGLDGPDKNPTRVWVDGTLAFEGGASPELKPGFDGAQAAVIQTADTLRIVLHPLVPFSSEALVQVRVVSATVGGAHGLDETYSFRAEDRTAPRVLAAQAIGPKIVRIAFDEPVVAAGPEGLIFEALDGPAVPLDVATVSASGPVVTVALGREMTPDATYRVRAVAVSDLAGNPAIPPFDATVFVGFRPPRPAGRRFDLWSMLPKHNRRADMTGDLRNVIACLQEPTDLLLAEIDRLPDIFDVERAPALFLDLILRDLGNPFPFDLDELGKRRLASVLVEMYQQKGTAIGIRNAIRFFLGVEVAAITPFAGTALVLGESELGVDWELGPSDRFSRYAFDLRVGVMLTDTQRRQLRAIVDYLKPAHTHFVDLIVPTPPPFIDHWEIGAGELGETSDLH